MGRNPHTSPFGFGFNFGGSYIPKPRIAEGKTKSNNKDTIDIKTVAPPPPAGPRRSAIMYMHVVENSHRWTDLKQMLEWLKYLELTENVKWDYLKTGLENTLNNGYNLFKLDELIKQNPNDNDLGKAIRKLNG